MIPSTPKRFVALVLDTLAVVALAVWLGGLAACWIALAPSVHSLPANAIPAAQTLFAETLRRFSAVTESCGVILAGIQWVLRRRYQHNQKLFVADGVRMVAMFVALFAAEYSRYVLVPALIKTQSPAAYNSIAGFAVAQAVLLIGYAGTTAWLQTPGLASGPITPVRPSPSPAPQPPRPAPKRRPTK